MHIQTLHHQRILITDCASTTMTLRSTQRCCGESSLLCQHGQPPWLGCGSCGLSFNFTSITEQSVTEESQAEMSQSEYSMCPCFHDAMSSNYACLRQRHRVLIFAGLCLWLHVKKFRTSTLTLKTQTPTHSPKSDSESRTWCTIVY